MWIPIAVSIISALTAILSAVLATRNAARSRESVTKLEREKMLEGRVQQRKQEIYKPMIEGLAKALVPAALKSANKEQRSRTEGKSLPEVFTEFAPWLAIVGSDDAVAALRNFMQGAYVDAPPLVLLRLYADFTLAARRDLGDTNTHITAVELLSTRISDSFSDVETWQAMTLPFYELAARQKWAVPWTRTGEEVAIAERERQASELQGATDE